MITAAKEQAIPVARRSGMNFSRELVIGTVNSRIPANARNESWKEMEKKYPGNIIRENEKVNTRILMRLALFPISLPRETKANIITARRSDGEMPAIRR